MLSSINASQSSGFVVIGLTGGSSIYNRTDTSE